MPLNNNFPRAPENVQEGVPYIRLLKQAINSIVVGKLNCTGELTLTASTTSTVVTEKLCTEKSVVLLMPVSANAAAAIATTYITPAKGEFTVTHALDILTDKDFRYVVIG